MTQMDQKRHRHTFLAMVLAYSQTSHVHALIAWELQAKNPQADAKKRANHLKIRSICRYHHTLEVMLSVELSDVTEQCLGVEMCTFSIIVVWLFISFYIWLSECLQSLNLAQASPKNSDWLAPVCDVSARLLHWHLGSCGGPGRRTDGRTDGGRAEQPGRVARLRLRSWEWQGGINSNPLPPLHPSHRNTPLLCNTHVCVWVFSHCRWTWNIYMILYIGSW